MSVTTDGMKGYEYQYKVTVLISLLPHIEKIELFVEKEGSEDALLKIKQENIDKTIEIQVKREKNTLDIVKVVGWLCHFQEYKSNNNLLQRIADSENVIALFVTQSRCSDKTVKLKIEIGSINIHDKISISDSDFKEWTEKLGTISLSKTKLMSDRGKFCQNQSKIFNSNSNLPKILQRVLIWEEFTDEKVDNQIAQMLNTKYQIAQSKTDNVYLELLEAVKTGRDTKNDILQDIYKILQTNKIGRPLVDSDYKSRSEEKNLIDYLTTNNILLLSGISQCGKTELAKEVSIYFFDKGYDFKIDSNVEEIRRFFSINISDSKIAILEDPWGHITPVDVCEESKRKIADLISNAESHHKLIITCRLEILFDIFKTENLDQCAIKGIKWHDLTIKDGAIINGYWQNLSKKALPENIVSLVSDNIPNSNSHHLLQIGQLRYLANEEQGNLINKSYSELEHIARRNSEEIANIIKQKGESIAEVLSVLAICATPIHSVCSIDLAYILSESTERMSIPLEISPFLAYSVTDLFKKKNPNFPEYPNNIHLSKDTQKSVEYLEERGFITVSDSKILFSHPNYYEAGRYLFFSKSESKQKRILERLTKCISCLNPINSYLATKQFSFFYNKIKESLKKDVIKIAFDGLKSIFPSVADNSFIFLINIMENIQGEQIQELIRKIQGGGISSLYNIYWHNKIPFISGEVSDPSIEVDNQLVKEVENELLNKILPDAHKAWVYIESLKDGKPVQSGIFKILLQYNEAFIREKVVYQVFKRLDEENKDIVLDIFHDEHPSVVFSAISASLINWFSFSQKLKEFVFNLIKKSLSERQISIRAFNLISTFSADYAHENIFEWCAFNEEQKTEMWNLWGKLYPITMRNLPLGVFMNTGRFGATMNSAMKYLDVNTGVQVLEAWLDRIDYQIKNGKTLDEFEMAIAESLMQLTDDDYNIRKDLFSRLITYSDTSFILSNLRWIIGRWDKLDISEKNQIINLIQSDRKDIRWIKAVSLNACPLPDEICSLILGEKELFSKDVDHVLSKFSAQLLRDCLNVYCGFQHFWWLGIHYQNRNFWEKVIRHILLNETHIGFDICLEEFLRNGVNGLRMFLSNDDVDNFSIDYWKDWETLWEQICNHTKEKKLLADRLIYNTANCTCNISTTNKLWTILLESYSTLDKENEIIALIVDNIELLQQTGDKEDLFEIFDKNFLLNKIIPALIPDSIIINLLLRFKTNPFFKDEEKIEVISKELKIIEGKNI